MTESFTPEANEATEPLADPVLADFALPLRGLYHPLGFSVEIITNSPAVLDAAQLSWGREQQVFPDPAITLKIGVTQDGSDKLPPPSVCRSRDNLLTMTADPQNFLVGDLNRGFGFGWLTQAAVEATAYFRYYFLEGMALSLLQCVSLAPVHAACVELDGHGVLLCGDSKAGKSSLAFACARRGWKFLCDDASAVVRKRPGRTVVGNPYLMRFRESSVALFPELRQHRVMPRATGVLAIEVATESMPEIAICTHSQVDFIVFLDRQSSGPRGLLPLSHERAWPWFERTICFGATEIRNAQKAALQNLLTAALFELHYSDLDWATRRLETLIREGA